MVSPLEPDLGRPDTLTGRWSWTRRVEDRYAGQQLTATGTLDLVPVASDVLSWTETGVLERADGSRVDVRRGLGLERRPEGWWVVFEDGHDFHPWTPGVEVVHPCRADTYRGTVTGDPTSWTVVWRVVGPAKDHTITTTLSGWVALSALSPTVVP